MPVFVTSPAQARRHGVYTVEVTPPAQITATGTGTCVIVDQFPWGPDQKLTYASDLATLMNMLAPAGASRTGAGWLALIRKSFAKIGFIRVTGTGAAAATATLGTACTVTLKYNGALGNSVTYTVGAAADGNSNHFDLTLTLTGTSGTTTEIFHNINVSGTGANALPSASDINRSVLLGSITVNTPGRPANGSGSFAGGADGTVASSDWTGTQGTQNRGIALAEGDRTVDFIFTGDPGNTLRPQVNAALQAHADYMTDRMAVINGPSGQTASAAQTDVASYRSMRCIYVDPWVYIYDDTDGTKRLVPPAPFVASALSKLVPSTSVAWKNVEVTSMFNGIVDIEVARGEASADNTAAGICTITPEVNGGWSVEAAVNTYYASDPTRGSIKRTRMGHYIARSITTSLRPYVDAPTVPDNINDQIHAIDSFLAGLKAAQKRDANHNTHILDYDLADFNALNPAAQLQSGTVVHGADITISPDMSKIFFQANYGETVVVNTGL